MNEIKKEVRPARYGACMGERSLPIATTVHVPKHPTRVYINKVQLLKINKRPIKSKLVLNIQSIGKVMNLKYLAVNITSNRNLREEVRAQTNGAAMISEFLGYIT